jgi:zinc protease
MISIGYKVGALAPGDRVWVASRVLAELAFGETSEIYRRLVLDEQIAQRISASPSSSRDPGLWTVNAVVVDAKDIDRVMAAIDETVARFRAAAPDAARVQAVKSHLRYQFIMGLDSPANVAGRLAHMAGVGGGIDAIEQMYRTLGDVTPADVQAAASEYLVSERRTVAVLRGKE